MFLFALFTNMFLVMFRFENAFFSRRISTVVACTFATVRLADHLRDGNSWRFNFNDCVGNRYAHLTCFTSLIKGVDNRTFCNLLMQSLHLRDVIRQHLPVISERAMEH